MFIVVIVVVVVFVVVVVPFVAQCVLHQLVQSLFQLH